VAGEFVVQPGWASLHVATGIGKAGERGPVDPAGSCLLLGQALLGPPPVPLSAAGDGSRFVRPEPPP